MKWHVKFTNACDIVCDVFDVFILGTTIEYIFIVVLQLSSLINEALNWRFGIGQISHRSKIDF